MTIDERIQKTAVISGMQSGVDGFCKHLDKILSLIPSEETATPEEVKEMIENCRAFYSENCEKQLSELAEFKEVDLTTRSFA